MKRKIPYKVKKRKVVFSKGPIHLVDCLVEVEGHKTQSRQILEHNGATVIIPKTKDNRYLLARQFRFAAGEAMWEWPAGGIEVGETPRKAAARELSEEVGYHPKRLKKMVSFYPTPGVSQEVMHLFLAEDLIEKKMPHDEDEKIEVGSFKLKEIGDMIERGHIYDAKTIIGYFYLTSPKFKNK